MVGQNNSANCLLQVEGESTIMSSASVMMVQRRWLKFLRRCLGLSQGRYIIVLSVGNQDCDWSVQEVGKVEQG